MPQKILPWKAGHLVRLGQDPNQTHEFALHPSCPGCRSLPPGQDRAFRPRIQGGQGGFDFEASELPLGPMMPTKPQHWRQSPQKLNCVCAWILPFEAMRAHALEQLSSAMQGLASSQLVHLSSEGYPEGIQRGNGQQLKMKEANRSKFLQGPASLQPGPEMNWKALIRNRPQATEQIWPRWQTNR